jgi:hypothetical protein
MFVAETGVAVVEHVQLTSASSTSPPTSNFNVASVLPSLILNVFLVVKPVTNNLDSPVGGIKLNMYVLRKRTFSEPSIPPNVATMLTDNGTVVRFLYKIVEYHLCPTPDGEISK